MTKLIEKLKELHEYECYKDCENNDLYILDMINTMKEIIIEQQQEIERFNQFYDSGTPIVVPNKRFLIPINKELK